MGEYLYILSKGRLTLNTKRIQQLHKKMTLKNEETIYYKGNFASWGKKRKQKRGFLGAIAA